MDSDHRTFSRENVEWICGRMGHARGTGLLTYGWPQFVRSSHLAAVVKRAMGTPITVAGQWRNFTAFPSAPRVSVGFQKSRPPFSAADSEYITALRMALSDFHGANRGERLRAATAIAGAKLRIAFPVTCT